MNLLKDIKNLATDITSGSKSSGNVENWCVTIQRGEGIRSKDDLSKSDAYLKIEFGGKHFETRAINNNINPQWNQTFRFQVSGNKDICLTLMDSDPGTDDTLGKAVISHSQLPTFAGQEKQLQVSLLRKGEVVGVVFLTVKREDGQNLSYNSQQQMSTQSNYLPQQQQQQQPMSSSYNQYNVPPNYNATTTTFNSSQQPYQSQVPTSSQIPSSSYSTQIPSSSYSTQTSSCPSHMGQQPQYSQGQQQYSQGQQYSQEKQYSHQERQENRPFTDTSGSNYRH